MVQRRNSNNAAMKDARTNPSREGCVSDMEQRSNEVAAMDALILPNVEECASGTGHFVILKTTLLHLIYHVDQHLMIRLQLFPIRA